MNEPADPTAGIAAYLASELGGKPNGLLSEGLAVFRPELPREREPEMPAECIVVLPDPSGGAGRLYGRTELPVWDSRIAIYCYGSTRLESDNLGRRVEAALRSLKQSTWETVRLYWARHEGGAQGLQAKVDPNTLWPVAVVFCQVMHDQYTV